MLVQVLQQLQLLPKGTAKSIDSEELAMLLDSVSSVIIVPGYGMAVGQAQHAVRDLMNIVREKRYKS